MEQSVSVASIVLFGWIISVCCHEFSHALVAYMGGDKSVKKKGYLNFNPFAYTDIRLSVILPTIIILIGGIGLPGASVQIREDQLRGPIWSSAVSAAGPFATFLFAVTLICIVHTGFLPPLWTVAFCWLINIEFVVLILNLLPIPGLDGFAILEPFIPPAAKKRLKPLYKHGFLILLLLLWVIPGPNQILWMSADFLLRLAGIPTLLVAAGQELCRQGSLPVAAAVIALAVTIYLLKKKFDWHEKGETLLKAEKYEECLNLMESSLKKLEDPRAYKMAALCSACLASAENDKSKAAELKEKAANYIEKCLALEPDMFENWIAKAFIAETFGHFEESGNAYDRALELNKSCDYAFKKRCELFCRQNNFTGLLEYCRQRRQLIPEDGDAVFYEGVSFAKLGQQDKALDCFNLCIKNGDHKELSLKNREIIMARNSKISANEDMDRAHKADGEQS